MTAKKGPPIPVTQEHRKACRQALDRLLEHFVTKAEIARQCKVARNTVSFWYSKGYIGLPSAMYIDARNDIPFTARDLRPDVSEDVFKNVRPVSQVEEPVEEPAA